MTDNTLRYQEQLLTLARFIEEKMDGPKSVSLESGEAKALIGLMRVLANDLHIGSSDHATVVQTLVGQIAAYQSALSNAEILLRPFALSHAQIANLVMKPVPVETENADG